MPSDVSPDLVQRDLAGAGLRVGARAVDLRVHDRVRRREVVLAHQLVVADEIGGALLVAAARPHVGARGEQRERDVEVVGRAAHHAAVVLGHLAHADAAALEVLARARLDERDVDRLTRGGRLVEAGVRVLVAPVEPARETARRAAEQGMIDDVVDLLAVHPDLAAVVLAGLRGTGRRCVRRSAPPSGQRPFHVPPRVVVTSVRRSAASCSRPAGARPPQACDSSALKRG